MANSRAAKLMVVHTTQKLIGLVVLFMTVANVFAATETPIALAQISEALSKGDAQRADRLVATTLAQPNLNKNIATLLLLDRAKVRELQDRLDDALTDFSTAILSNELTDAEKTDALLDRGLLLDALNRPDDAIGDFGAALQLDPDSAKALNDRADVYRRQNRIPEAQHDYLAALATRNAAAEYSYFGLGQIAESDGDLAAARDFYAKSLAVNPKYSLASDRLKSLGGAPPATLQATNLPSATSPSKPQYTPAAPPASTATVDQPPALPPQVVVSAKPSPEQESRNAVGRNTNPNSAAQVQLGAWSSREKAAAVWKQAVQLVGKSLGSLSPSIVPVNLPGKGHLFRLRVMTAGDAATFCASLKAAGVDCIAVSQ